MNPSVLRLAALLAGAACILAGGYLLTSDTADPNSYLEIIAHGLGIYMIGKGIFVWALLYMHAGEIDVRERESLPPSAGGNGEGRVASAAEKPSALA